MSDRKATFAKRQRESELKEKAKLKEERRVSRRSGAPRQNKGPEIAWDEAVNITTNPIDVPPVAVADQAAANDDDGPPPPPPPTTPSPTPRR
jgi:hypothetical protein